MSKHTPGPWKTCGWNNLLVNASNGNTIVCCPGGSHEASLEELQANARLIAAAPEMLDLCVRATNVCQIVLDVFACNCTRREWDEEKCVHDLARSVLAEKAKGSP